MVFSSPLFLFLFLPLFILGYHLVFLPGQVARSPRQRRLFHSLANGFILLSSLLFYFWGEAWLTLVMLGSTTIDFGAGWFMGRAPGKRVRRALLTISILANLSILAFFKYAWFGVHNANRLMHLFGLGGWSEASLLAITLPLGVSFYTFQSMSYTIDIYRGQVKPTRNFLDFACYVTMFPQLVAGPIVRYRSVADQLAGRILSFDLFGSGVVRFITGLGKKVLISNLVAVPADRIFALPADQLSTPLAWLGVLSYTLQIYFDFSGYSDMAIGLGRMLGFRYPENFNYPYAATSIQDFWRRWHISLSTWFRDYLYIPLGGGRGRPRRIYFNLVVVFFLCGLWHGASWSFVVWGLYHGLFLVLERLGLGGRLAAIPRPMRHAYVLLTAMGGWVLFRSVDLVQAASFFKAMAGFAGDTVGEVGAAPFLTGESLAALVLGAFLSWPVLPLLRKARLNLQGSLKEPGHALSGVAYGSLKVTFLMAVLFLSCASLASDAYNPFIYFRF